MIKTVFLDLDDTILDFHAAEAVAIADTFREIGIPPTDGTLTRYKEINRSCWERLERGELEREEVLLLRFEMLFSELKKDLSPKDTQKLYEYKLGCEHPFLEGGEELLRTLSVSGKYDLYIASNGIERVQTPRIQDSGIAKYFKDIFISEQLGYNKPDIRFFEAAAARIPNYDRSEAVIVGDSLSSDILGGRNAGIKTCHFNPRKIKYTTIVPDYEIKSLDELPALLEKM